MREILFRGQRIDNGEWVYGSLITAIVSKKNKSINTFIKLQDAVETNLETFVVKPESIGQFTGLLDKNKNKIFEGDLCRCEFGLTGIFKKAIVYYESACFYVDDKDPSGNLTLSYFHKNSKEIEIIGNIHEKSKV